MKGLFWFEEDKIKDKMLYFIKHLQKSHHDPLENLSITTSLCNVN